MSPVVTTKNSSPLVTIGIAAYNAADTVGRAVDSAIAQTWRPTEIVVVDDSSNDTTPTILARLAAGRTDMRVYNEPANGGVGAARNRLVELARGEFIAFFDDDDHSTPDRVTRQVTRILEYERDHAKGAPVICHTARRQHFADGSELIVPTMGTKMNEPAPAGQAVAERVLLGEPLADGYGACATCSQMGRSSVYRGLDGFDPTFRRSEDTEFAIRLAKAGGHFAGIPDPLVDQYMTAAPDRSLGGERDFAVKLLEKHRDVADRYGLYDFCREWIELRQDWLEGRRGSFLVRFSALAAQHPLRTARRLSLALPHLGLNRALRRFHGGGRRPK